MPDSVGTVTTNVGSVKAPIVTIHAPSTDAQSQNTNSASSSNASSGSQLASLPASFENPKIVQDPTAGYITEYLSANGSEIIAQVPSAVVVAYLRDGLNRDGTPKQATSA